MSWAGTVTVTVSSATNIPKVDATGHSDPYVLVTLGSEKKKTTPKDNTANPTWNESFFLLYLCLLLYISF